MARNPICQEDPSREVAHFGTIGCHRRDGDTLVVWRLDRLGRSLKDLIERIAQLHNRNIGFKSLTESIDTTTSGGKLIFHIFGHWRNLNGV
jgi:hypothetical protein